MANKFCVKELPTKFNDMDSFVGTHKSELTEQVVSSIEYATKNNLSNIEVFSFRDTDYIAVINIDKFKENLDNIYNYYINTEQYEFCGRVVKVQKLLLNYLNSNEQN